MSRARLWVISELYYPEETSTGYFVTRIAEGLAEAFEVHAVCSRPSYSERHVAVPWRELHAGVEIHRMRSTRFNKDTLVGRVLNLTTFTFWAGLFCLLKLRRGDRVLVLTNPPTMPLLAGLMARLRRARPYLLVHDVYPEVLIATGLIGEHDLSAKILGQLTATTYRIYEKIVVLGRDMSEIVVRRLGGNAKRVEIITNWGDLDEVRPLEPRQNEFTRKHVRPGSTVIQFSGNIGRTHDVEAVLSAAWRLEARKDIVFQFIGAGGKSALVSDGRRAPANVTYLSRQPRNLLGPMLSSANAVVIPFLDRMLGVSVPSRMYNVMSAGTAIIAMAHSDSELAKVVTEERCGWAIPPGDTAELARLAEYLATPEGQVDGMERGLRGRTAVARRFSLPIILSQYSALFAEEGPCAIASPRSAG